MSTGESIGRAVFQASGRVHCGVRPAPGAGFDTFDLRRLRDCFVQARGGTAPAGDDVQGWEALAHHHSDRSGTNGSSEGTPSPRARALMKVPFQDGQTK